MIPWEKSGATIVEGLGLYRKRENNIKILNQQNELGKQICG